MRRMCLGMLCGALSAAIVLAGCNSDAAGDASAVTIRDSAGIRIVENHSPEWAAGEGWKVSDDPFLEIGTPGGDPQYEMMRVNGLVRLSDGRIAVGNDGSQQVRFYGPKGEFLAASGRQGTGPGEFRQIMGLRRMPGDTLQVLDVGQVQTLTPAGQFVRVLGPQFGGGFIAAGGGHRFYAGFSERHEITAFIHEPAHPDTTAVGSVSVSSIIRWRSPESPVADELKDEYRTKVLTQPGEDGRPPPADLVSWWEQLVQDFTFADAFPAYSALRLDRSGNLWVRGYDHREEMPGTRWGLVRVFTNPWPTPWQVFDPEGRWLGAVQLPAFFEPLEIGEDYVAGVGHDRDEVEYVRFYSLTKS